MKFNMIIFIFFILFCNGLYAQFSTSEFSNNQRVALAKFLNTHSQFEFVPEGWFDQEVLKWVREDWGYGKHYKPYYNNNDFNKDGIKDFAVYLKNNKKNFREPGNFAVVIFNGMKNGNFKFSYLGNENYSDETGLIFSKGKLHIKQFETDNEGCYIAAGETYILEPCE
jgi:hypothetical protein